jgi:c-di-GMP-binding flagellar brake protein YcgR
MRVKTDIAARARSTAQPDAIPIDCKLMNISVSGARVDAPAPLPRNEELISLQFTLAVPGRGQDAQVDTLAMIRNVSTEKGADGLGEIYAYGVQFIDLDPVHYTLLQNMTYEALLADRMKIV